MKTKTPFFLWSNRIHACAHISDVADRIESDNGLFAPELEKTAFLEGVARTAQSFFENDDFFITKNYEFSKKQWKRRFFLEALGPCVLCHRMHPHEIARLHVQRRVANLRRMY